MRRFITVTCVLLSLLLMSAFAWPITAGTSFIVQRTGGTFSSSPATFTTPGKVNALIPLNDGRMLVGGSLVTIAGQATPRSLAIIKNDGSLDATFQVDPGLQVVKVNAAAVQGDGKIIISGWFRKPPAPSSYSLLRLYPNGTVDDTFQPNTINGQVFAVLVDGLKILVGGDFTSPTPRIARLDLNGTADSTFNGVGSGPDSTVRSMARQSSGKYILAGEFESFNGTSQAGVARLNTNGSLDTLFAPGGFMASQRLAVLNDDSVVVGGENICGDGLFAWFTAGGALKPSLSPEPDLFQSITAFLPLPDGGFLIGGWYSSSCINESPTQHEGQVWRYAADGSYRTMTTFGNESDVLALALRSDGKVMLGGQGRPATSDQVGLFDGLALLDLSNDGLEKVGAFHLVVGDEAEIYSLSRYPDSKLLVAGNFSHVNGSPHFGLARLLANGALDTSFHPFADQPGGWSYAALALSDGRAMAGFRDSGLYLIGAAGGLVDLSAFNNYDRVSALAIQGDRVLVGSNFGLGVRRLKADFSGADTTFTAGDAYGAVHTLAVQDNKIFVAGDFSTYNTEAVPGLVRLDSNGGIDSSFSPPVFMDDIASSGALYSVTPLSNGNVLVGGYFNTVGGAQHPGLVRLTGTGALDAGFTSPTGFHTIKTVCVQSNGSIWAGGIENSYYRNPLVSHLSENGLVDATFQSAYQGAHDAGVVNAVLCDTGGLSWAGGRFSLSNGRPFYGLARCFPLVGQAFLPVTLR